MPRDPCKACAPLVAALESQNAKLRATNARLVEQVEFLTMGNAEKARHFKSCETKVSPALKLDAGIN